MKNLKYVPIATTVLPVSKILQEICCKIKTRRDQFVTKGFDAENFSSSDKIALYQMEQTEIRHDDDQHATTEAQLHPLKEITYGAVSGMVGKLVEFPFDTIKVRLQSNNNSHPVSTISMISHTFRNEGV